MVEPVTNNKGIIIPNTGDLSGTWGSAAVNPNMSAIDGMFGGFTTIGLTNANVTLTVPAGFTAAPSAGPTQAQNALLRFTGALSGNCFVTLPMPGFYLCENLCTNTRTFSVIMTVGAGATEVIALPPGEMVQVFSDGAAVRFVNLGQLGEYKDVAANVGFAVAAAWIGACTIKPWLNCDGTTYNISSFPQLGALLGNTFGGDGVSTFAVPDLRNRVRLSAGSLISGTISASGGETTHLLTTGEMPVHAHGVTDPTHTHTDWVPSGLTITPGSGGLNGVSAGNTGASATGITINNAGGGNPHNNLQPYMVAGITLIKT